MHAYMAQHNIEMERQEDEEGICELSTKALLEKLLGEQALWHALISNVDEYEWLLLKAEIKLFAFNGNFEAFLKDCKEHKRLSLTR